MTERSPVYLTRSKRVEHFVAVLAFIALAIALLLYGWFFQSAIATFWLAAFGVLVSGFTLWLIRKSRSLRFDSSPVFVFCSDGIELSPDNLLPWDMLKDAVVFTWEGDKFIGLRLREDLYQWERCAIEAKVGHTNAWQLFGMPLTMDYSGLTVSGEGLINQLQISGLKVTIMEKELFLGEETELN